MSLPERLLWRQLRQRPADLKFRKQHPAGYYALDFYCAAAKLCVEVDGHAHDTGDQPAFDHSRDSWLALHDVRTLRVPARDVLGDIESVIIRIVEAARARLPLHHPASPGGPPPRSGEESGISPC